METQNKQVKKWDGEKIVEEKKTIEERLKWCEEYISILLKQKDEMKEQIHQLRRDLETHQN